MIDLTTKVVQCVVELNGGVSSKDTPIENYVPMVMSVGVALKALMANVDGIKSKINDDYLPEVSGNIIIHTCSLLEPILFDICMKIVFSNCILLCPYICIQKPNSFLSFHQFGAPVGSPLKLFCFPTLQFISVN